VVRSLIPCLIAIILSALLCELPAAARISSHSGAEGEQVCDPLADYYLGMEDYAQAIQRHRVVIKRDPSNALAHYHLGFAYGLVGEHRQELAEYQKAIALGLDDWHLFLNLGLLYLEGGHSREAIEVLKLATLLGPRRAETHFNLGLAYERRGDLPAAEQELLLSLRLDPDQLDARNTLGAIYAQEGNYVRANEEWTELVKANPDYAPARANLNILHRVEHGELEGTSPAAGFAHLP
jgi:tetratricopeptide (TPR) repeat protein